MPLFKGETDTIGLFPGYPRIAVIAYLQLNSRYSDDGVSGPHGR